MMLPLLLLAVSTASVVVTVEKSDGQPVVFGELLELNSESVAWRGRDGKIELPRADIRRIVFPEAAGVRAVELPEAFARLTDGSIVPCEAVTMLDGQIDLVTVNDTSVRVQDATMRDIRWPSPGEAADTMWNEILAKSRADDLLVIRREKSLDYLPGLVVGISSTAVQFEFRGNQVNVPLSRVAGVVFARNVDESPPPPRVRLTTHDGGIWMLESVAAGADRLTFKAVSGIEGELPLSEIRELEYPRLDAVYLSDMQPEFFEFYPYWGSQPDLANSLQLLYSPRNDVSFDDTPLRIHDATLPSGWRQFRRGLAVHSRTELGYRLAKNFRRFQTTIGFDPDAPDLGHVELTILADDEPRLVRQIAAGDDPLRVDMDVAGVNRLKLLVDFGEHMDIGDRIHFGEARLTK